MKYYTNKKETPDMGNNLDESQMDYTEWMKADSKGYDYIYMKFR